MISENHKNVQYYMDKLHDMIEKEHTLKTHNYELKEQIKKFEAMQHKPQTIRGNLHEEANKVPRHVDYYKAQLKEKDRQLKDISSKVRRMLASEHSYKIM